MIGDLFFLEMISYILPILLILIILTPIVWVWVSGLDYMDKHHPDYKGDDLFDEFED